jgi:hypothetical protein
MSRTLVNAVGRAFGFPYTAGNCLTKWGPVSFSGRTLLYGISQEAIFAEEYQWWISAFLSPKSMDLHLSYSHSCKWYFPMAQQPLVCKGLIIIEASPPNWHTTLGGDPLDEWSALRRDLYLPTHNSHKRQTSMLPSGFEPAITARERPQTHSIDCAATGIGFTGTYITYILLLRLFKSKQCRILFAEKPSVL